MKTLTLAFAASLMATAAVAQNAPTPQARPGAPVVTTTPGATLPRAAGTNSNTGTPAGAGMVDRNTGTAAAAGDRNQAVTTTGANAPQPAKGANSFTDGEARRRLEKEGFTTVTDLKKDNEGVWRGKATKGGNNVGVWLDYKGNIGQQ